MAGFITSQIGLDATADTLRQLLLGLAGAITIGTTVGVTVGLSRRVGEASPWSGPQT